MLWPGFPTGPSLRPKVSSDILAFSSNRCERYLNSMAIAMANPGYNREINETCRQAIREPVYSPELTAQLIEWLHLPNAAWSELAGLALMKFGQPAFDDLLEYVEHSPKPIAPRAIWVLGSFPAGHAAVLPKLRRWANDDSDEIVGQAVLSLADVLRHQLKSGLTPDAMDVDTCRAIMRDRASRIGGAARLHWREFVRDFGDGATV